MPSEVTSKFDRSVSLLCWAYNEEASIGEYLERALALLSETVEEFEIVLVDDASEDRTNEIARDFQREHPELKIFRNERNLNVGYSSRRAIGEATKEYLFWQTIDWGYDISRLREYLEHLKSYDIVQGARIGPVRCRLAIVAPFAWVLRSLQKRNLLHRSDTVGKAFVSLVNYAIIRTLFRVPLSDYQNVTFYPREWIQSVTYEARSSFANPEGLIKSYWNGKSFKEVPIGFIPRTEGEAKGTRPQAVLSSVKDIVRLWFSWIVLGRRGRIRKGRIVRLGSC